MRRKRVLFLSCLLILMQQTAISAQEIADYVGVNSEAINVADSIIYKAYRYLGRPYRSGGKGPTSFDCSGFTHYLYKTFGYNISDSSRSQAKDGVEVEGGFNALQKGDILVFSSRDKSRIGHVGLYVGPDDNDPDNFKFIHAAVHGGVIVSSIHEPYYASRYIGARRILPTFITSSSTDTVQPIPSIEHSSFTKTSIVRSSSSAKHSYADYYTIKKGDVLYKIAEKFNITIEDLCRLNSIPKGTTPKIGTKILIREPKY